MLELILTIIGGGGIFGVITYLLTIRSKTKQAKSEAKTKEILTQHEQLDLNQDMCDYLQKVTDKYIRDYHELESNFRKEITLLRNTTESLLEEKAKIIAEKCTEIALLQARVTYLEGVSCYDFTCLNRKDKQ